MLSAREQINKRMQKNKAIITIPLNIPEDILDTLKEMAGLLEFSSPEALIRYYIGKGLRKDLVKYQ